jgi:hypothetical protein
MLFYLNVFWYFKNIFMLRRLLSIFVIVLCIIWNFPARGQVFDSSMHRFFVSERNLTQVSCGASASYFKSLTSSLPTGEGGTAMVLPGVFPPWAVDTCGKFRIFYADRVWGTGNGFDGPTGLNRRNLLCQVLTYVQATIDFSLIPPGQYIRIYVDTSYAAGVYPAPYGTDFYARAGALYNPLATGVVNGYVHDFVLSGIDPAAGAYHASMQFNFHRIFALLDPTDTLLESVPISYYEGFLGMDKCKIDLYSTMLHEITHIMGWSSYMSIWPGSVPASVYSSIDTSVHYAPRYTSLTSLAKNLSGGFMLASPLPKDNTFWISGKQAPDNYPVYTWAEYFSGYKFSDNFAHLNGSWTSYHLQGRNSPGDYMDYVMEPAISEGVTRRVFSKAELQVLHDILGYNYTVSIATDPVVINKLPWSSKMASVAYDQKFHLDSLSAYYEKLPADKILVNDIGATWLLNLSADTTLKDEDGDLLRVYPGSLVNFRGCGEGGNNHNRLTLAAGGTQIIYTPRHNFYGRAQFGFNLYDGKEKGGFVLYTIDVKRGTNVSSLPGENLVINGDFEEGTEVKLRNTHEDVNNTSFDMGLSRSGRLHGAHFADGHPYDLFPNFWLPGGGGVAIKNAAVTCDSTFSLTYAFGSEHNAFPNIWNPLQPGDTGNRYQIINSHGSLYYYLSENLSSCKKYKLSFDANTPSYIVPAKGQFQVGFLSEDYFSFDTVTWYNFPYPKLLYRLMPHVKAKPEEEEWIHYEVPFTYCQDTAANVLVLKYDGSSGYTMRLDNISIVEDTLPTMVTIMDSLMLPCGNVQLLARISNPTVYSCLKGAFRPFDVYWTANGDTLVGGDTIIYVSPKVPTQYIVYIDDGCHVYSDTIDVPPAVGPVVNISDTAVCYGATAHLVPVVTDTVGAVLYSWAPADWLSCTTCPDPVAAPDTSITYSLTVTDMSGCFTRPVTVTVHPLPVFSVVADTLCPGTNAVLKLEGDDDYTYVWDAPVACDTCTETTSTVLLYTSEGYPVSATDRYGCISYDTAEIIVKPVPDIAAGPKGITICPGDTLELSVSGILPGTAHWFLHPDLSCLHCDTTTVVPFMPVVYSVHAVGENGCPGEDTVKVHVHPAPNITASSSDSTVCGAGYITLSATGGLTYSWAPTWGVSNPTWAVTPAYVASTTPYIVTGTNAFGCTASDTVTVSALPLPTVTISSPFEDLCLTDSVTLLAGGAVTYAWSPATVTPCVTCNPVRAAVSGSSTTYTLTGTDVNGCIGTAYKTFTRGGCGCSPSNVFGAAATTITTPTLTGTLPAGRYYLPANLTITGTTTLTGVNILIERGVTITVANNAKLILDNSHLFTCTVDTATAMWQGIILASTGAAPGGTSGRIEVRNNTLIEDAMFAIRATNIKTPSSGDVISVTNSTFNRNYIDIYMEDYRPATPAVLPITIYGNLFTSRLFNGTVMPGYPNSWTSTSTLKNTTTVIDSKPAYFVSNSFAKVNCKAPDVVSYIGIRAANLGLTTGVRTYTSELRLGMGSGEYTPNYNLFDNSRYGFVSDNSNAVLFHNHFINIGRRIVPGAPEPIEGGMGVRALNTMSGYRTRLLPAAFGNYLNSFHDCYTGIYAQNVARLDVNQCRITTSNTAGATAAGAAVASDLYSGYGIMVYNDRFLDTAIIASNHISNCDIGIRAHNLNPPAASKMVISGNSLLAKNGNISSAFTARQYMRKGVELYSDGLVASRVAYTDVVNNHMNNVFNGITASGYTVSRCSVAGNTITLWDTTTPVTTIQYGIRMTVSRNATISNNIVSTSALNTNDDHLYAYSAAFNQTLRICENTAQNTGRGFDFAGGSVQPATRWIGNTMTNNYKGMALASDIGDQGYMTSYFTPFTFWGAIGNTWTGAWGALKQQTVAINYINTLNSRLWVNNITSGSVERPIFNESDPGLLAFPLKYLHSGISGSLLVSTAQQAANCYGSLLPEYMKPVMLIGRKVVTDSLGYDNTYHRRQWMSQLGLYEGALAESDLRDSSALLDSFFIAAGASRLGWLGAVSEALGSADTAGAAALLAAPVSAMGRVAVQGSNIVITDYDTADAIVADYAAVYAAYLRYMKGNLLSGDTALLEAIAAKCPAQDGAVVYLARTLFTALSGIAPGYPDSDECPGTSSNYRKAPAESDVLRVSGYSLHPNPNGGSFKLCGVEGMADIKVYNAVGIPVYKQDGLSFEGGCAFVDMGSGIPGVYLACITTPVGETVCLKFVLE